MIDAHCHLMDIKEFKSDDYADMNGMINCGYSIETSISAIEMKNYGKRIFCSVGLGPQKCMHRGSLIDVGKIERIIKDNCDSIDAVGEAGLDFHWGDSAEKRSMQIQCFKRIVEIAETYSKPLVIHSRDAMDQCLDILKKFNGKVMFHFFSGNAQHAKNIADNGWYISIPPIKGKGRIDALGSIEIDHVLAETDAPYVGNTPLDTAKSISIIADAKEMDFSEADKTTERNCLKFIGN